MSEPRVDPADQGQEGDEERIHAQEAAEGPRKDRKVAPDVREHSQEPAEGEDPADPIE